MRLSAGPARRVEVIRSSTQIPPCGISISELVTASDLLAVLPGEAIFLIVYPRWYDPNGERPILRNGVIASDPLIPYRSTTGDATRADGPQQIAIEVFSVDGNSGRPVFLQQRGLERVETDSLIITAQIFVQPNCWESTKVTSLTTAGIRRFHLPRCPCDTRDHQPSRG